MPTHKSAKKRVITSQKANLRNRAYRSRLKTAIKQVLSATTKETAQAELRNAYSVIDKTVQAGVIHRNNAANQKSRLTKVVAKIGA